MSAACPADLRERLRKCRGFAEHVLDAHRAVAVLYALAEPMFFDRALVERHRRGRGGVGLILMRNRLYLDCVHDVVRLTLDTDARTATVAKIMDMLDDARLVAVLRAEYAIPTGTVNVGDYDDPAAFEALERREAKEEGERFDAMLAATRERWKRFLDSDTTRAFKTIRDSVTAHRGVRLVNGEYQVVRLAELGLTRTSVREKLAEIEPIVMDLQSICRRAGFAIEDAHEINRKIAVAFWSPDG